MRALLAFAVGILLVHPTSTSAQVVVTTTSEARTGWIGISFATMLDEQGQSVAVVITQVSPNSPAAAAGVRAGDRLLAVNELRGPEELSELSRRLVISPGDDVTLLLERDRRTERVTMRAAASPGQYDIRVRTTYDDAWVEAMQNVRVEVTTDGQHISERPGQVRAPLEFFVFRGEPYDSLRREQRRLNTLVAGLQDQVAFRVRELSSSEAVHEVQVSSDPQLSKLQSLLVEIDRRSTSLEGAMAQAARNAAGLRQSEPPRPAQATAPSDPGWREFRPMTPYLLGRNRIAGAEVTDMSSELAQYFDVDQGVLILDVGPGTPADLSGLRSGDVIVRAGRRPVVGIEDARYAVTSASDSLQLTVIRRGEPMTLNMRWH